MQEKILEHRFVAELTSCLWLRGIRDIEVLRSEVDAFGHDLVIEANGVIRHIQLKSSRNSAKTARVNINTRLSTKSSGCVIWYLYDPDTLELGPFRWLGTLPDLGLPDLGDRVTKHSQGDGEGHKGLRHGLRVLPKARFNLAQTIDEIASYLFGFDMEDELALINEQLERSEQSDLAQQWVQEVRIGDLRAIPSDLDWRQSLHLAHLVDGYALARKLGLGDAMEFEERQLKHAMKCGDWLGGPSVLWTTLFLEHRRWRTASCDPDPEMERLLDQLCNQLVRSLGVEKKN